MSKISRKAHESENALREVMAKMARIVLLDQSKCRPNMPAFDYLRKNSNTCPASCIQVIENKCIINEDCCAACLNRAKRCPNGATRIVNVPHSFAKQVTFRYGPNSFKLHKLPVPRINQVLGLVGTNGIGKSTALKILGGLKPTLGSLEAGGVYWEDVLSHFRGSELQTYFTRLLDQPMRAVTKPQFVDLLAKALSGRTVLEILRRLDSRGVLDEIVTILELQPLASRRGEYFRVRTCAPCYSLLTSACSNLDSVSGAAERRRASAPRTGDHSRAAGGGLSN